MVDTVIHPEAEIQTAAQRLQRRTAPSFSQSAAVSKGVWQPAWSTGTASPWRGPIRHDDGCKAGGRRGNPKGDSRLQLASTVLKEPRFLIRILFGRALCLRGSDKTFYPGAFAIEPQRYQSVPWIVGALLASYVPWLEILAGAFLLSKKTEWGALLVTTLILFIFTAALASAALRGLNIHCGCFGKAYTATGTVLPLVRNLALLGCTAVLWPSIGDYA
jgi:putative oxidoreductase